MKKKTKRHKRELWIDIYAGSHLIIHAPVSSIMNTALLEGGKTDYTVRSGDVRFIFSVRDKNNEA